MNGDKDRYNNRQVISGFRVQSSESRVYDLTERRPLFEVELPISSSPLSLFINNQWTTSPIYKHLLFLLSMLIWTQGHPWVEKCEWSEPSAESGTPWLRPLQHQPRWIVYRNLLSSTWLTSFPGPHPASRRLQYGCKWQEAVQGPRKEA